jgi:hypothetical protein
MNNVLVSEMLFVFVFLFWVKMLWPCKKWSWIKFSRHFNKLGVYSITHSEIRELSISRSLFSVFVCLSEFFWSFSWLSLFSSPFRRNLLLIDSMIGFTNFSKSSFFISGCVEMFLSVVSDYKQKFVKTIKNFELKKETRGVSVLEFRVRACCLYWYVWKCSFQFRWFCFDWFRLLSDVVHFVSFETYLLNWSLSQIHSIQIRIQIQYSRFQNLHRWNTKKELVLGSSFFKKNFMH